METFEQWQRPPLTKRCRHVGAISPKGEYHHTASAKYIKLSKMLHRDRLANASSQNLFVIRFATFGIAKPAASPECSVSQREGSELGLLAISSCLVSIPYLAFSRHLVNVTYSLEFGITRV